MNHVGYFHFPSLAKKCPSCGHPQGEHAAGKDPRLGGWPCLADEGCDCVQKETA